MRRKPLGRYIVADPEICHGKPTFKGTRILVVDVLELVANEMAWDEIVKECHGRLTREGIAEAIELAKDALNHRGKTTKPKSVPV